MNNRSIVTVLLVISGAVSLYLLISTGIDGYWIWGDEKTRYDVTGQIGDFIGGVIGTMISGAGFYFLYLTFREQRLAFVAQGNAFTKERLESKFFEMIK